MTDAGNGVNVEDIPFRFQECLICGLAYTGYEAARRPRAHTVAEGSVR
jgi:hypothetical protein